MSVFVLEILTFLYYANERSNNVINSEMLNQESPEILGQSFSNLASHQNVHHERNRMAPIMLLPWQHACPSLFLVKKNKYSHLEPFKGGAYFC